MIIFEYPVTMPTEVDQCNAVFLGKQFPQNIGYSSVNCIPVSKPRIVPAKFSLFLFEWFRSPDSLLQSRDESRRPNLILLQHLCDS